MSHFTVAVITKDGNYQAALEPFDAIIDPMIMNKKNSFKLLNMCVPPIIILYNKQKILSTFFK